MRRLTAALATVSLLAGCGGGGGGGSTGSGTTTGTGTTGSAVCSLRDRQDWAAAQLRENYLFPETLPATLDPTPYATVSDYIDALTATARAQRRDRFFTYLTSIAEEDAFNNAGSSAGFGIRIFTDAARSRAFVTEAFEGAPALAAGIDRGTEILAIGAGSADLRTVASIFASSGGQGVLDALGPTTAGVTRLLRVTDAAGGTRDLTVTKTAYTLTPVSSRYGARVLTDGGRTVGYLNLRTFISTADSQLRNAFASFRSQGVTDVIVDLRYNGGGLIATSEILADLLGRDRATGEVIDYQTFRPEKSSSNVTRVFTTPPQSVAPMRLTFIGTGATASASELVINAFTPYLHARSALIGANTFGKPVGQIAVDRARCDDRLRVVAFAVQNSLRQGDYYDGLAGKVEASCAAADDLSHPFGDPQEASIRQALDFIAGRVCTPIATGQSGQSAGDRRMALTPEHPTVAQREVTGAF